MLDDVIRQACDPDKQVRSAARDRLRELTKGGTCTHGDAERLVRAAVDECEALQACGEDGLPDTIWAASELARDLDPTRLLDAVEDVFPRLNPNGRLCALRIVVLSQTTRAAEMYVTLLKAHGDALGVGYFSTFEPSSEVAPALFPAALELLSCKRASWYVLEMLLEFRQSDLLSPTVASGHEPVLCHLLESHLRIVRRLQRPSGTGWRDEQPYAASRGMVGLLFDLAAYLTTRDLARLVRDATDLVDARLRRFRAITLMRSGGIVADEELAWIAMSPRDRYWLFAQLVDSGLKHRLPPACRDQGLLAEGALVNWLCYETELGREPDEIELFHVESRRMTVAKKPVPFMKKRTSVDYYFFKYRVTEEHWARKDGWMVGMAGGYDRAHGPTVSGDGSTFSHFKPFESKSIKEHVADYLD